MTSSRRDLLLASATITLASGLLPLRLKADDASGHREKERTPMYGLIGKMTATDGQRDALITILLDGVSGMPGCLSYIVARDPADANAIWITEVWTDQASHQASLKMPSVQAAIAKGRPLIAGFSDGVTTEPVGGHGLPASQR